MFEGLLLAWLRRPAVSRNSLSHAWEVPKCRQTPKRKKGAEIWNLDSLVMQGAAHLKWRFPPERLGRFFLLLVKEVATADQCRQE